VRIPKSRTTIAIVVGALLVLAANVAGVATTVLAENIVWGV
jgi:hypothetical protein